jgi:DNA-binding transcriptional LysR family regulator
MYQLDDLLLFARVVENKSFLKTALELDVTQPTIGRRIKLLAEYLGYELFIISDGNHLTVTAFGNTLYRIIKQKMSYLDELKSAVNELIQGTTPEAGHLNLLLPPTASELFFTPLIPEFNIRYPNITLYINYEQLIVDFEQDEYDIAIVAYKPLGENQRFIKLLDLSLSLFCTKNYIEKYGLPNSISDIESHRYFSMTMYGKTLDSIDFIHRETEIVETFRPSANRLVVTDHRNALRLIKSNEFIGPCHDFLCKNDPSIIKVLPEYTLDVSNRLYLLKNSYKKNPVIDLFTDFIQKELTVFMANGNKP